MLKNILNLACNGQQHGVHEHLESNMLTVSLTIDAVVFDDVVTQTVSATVVVPRNGLLRDKLHVNTLELCQVTI